MFISCTSVPSMAKVSMSTGWVCLGVGNYSQDMGPGILWNMVSKVAVSILLECFLIQFVFLGLGSIPT